MGHTLNPRSDMKIPDPAGNRSRTSGLEGRDSTDGFYKFSRLTSVIGLRKQDSFFTIHALGKARRLRVVVSASTFFLQLQLMLFCLNNLKDLQINLIIYLMLPWAGL